MWVCTWVLTKMVPSSFAWSSIDPDEANGITNDVSDVVLDRLTNSIILNKYCFDPMLSIYPSIENVFQSENILHTYRI